MWPEGQTISFGRPVMRVASHGKSVTLISESENKTRTVQPLPVENSQSDPAALDNARREGFLMGRESALKEVEPVRAFLKTCADALQAETRKAANQLDAAAVKLALEIAEKLLERELKDPDTFRDSVMRVLRLTPRNDTSVLRVHPSSIPLLKSRDSAAGTCDWLAKTTLVEDDTIEPGGCMVQTPQGSWNGQMSERIALVARELGCDETSS